ALNHARRAVTEDPLNKGVARALDQALAASGTPPAGEMRKWGNEEKAEPRGAVSTSSQFPISSLADAGLRGEAFLSLTSTRFFGREVERVHLAALLRAPRTRLVTLTGAGGTGKTRLAIEVAASMVEARDEDGPDAAACASLVDVTEGRR